MDTAAHASRAAATLTRVPAAALIPVVYLIAVTPELVRTDLRERRLPNRMVIPGIVIGMIAAALQPSVLPVLAALGYAGLLLVLALVGGVGMGDVKLAALIGLACPAASAAVGAPIAAFLLGGLFSVALLVARRAGRKSGIPFGPWMLAGAVLGVVAGPALWSAYIGAFG